MSISTTTDVSIDEQPGVLRRVAEMLGVGRLRTDQDLVALVENQLSTQVLDGLRRSGLSDNEIYALVLPRRTLTHRLARREPLSRDESDRVVRIVRLAALGEAVFGDPERFWRWSRAPKRGLQDRSPLQMLVTETGARLVEEYLYRIDEGMAA